MKIEQLLLSFDEGYAEIRNSSDISIFEYLFEVFGIVSEKDCSALSVVSAKLKQMLRTRPDMPSYENAEILSDVTTMLNAFITNLHVNGIQNALGYIANFEDPVTLLEAKQAMVRLQEITSSKVLEMYKEVFEIRDIQDFVPVIAFDSGGIQRYAGILGGAANISGYRALGVCYTTSQEDVHEIAPDLVVPAGSVYPLLTKKGDNNPFAQISLQSTSIRAKGVKLDIPILNV